MNWGKAQLYIISVIKGQRKGILATLLKGCLLTVSWGFRCVTACRNWVFDSNCVRCYFPPVPLVISVGNIVAGGTGKTPTTLMLAQEFYEDAPIAILSRGYRSPAEKLKAPLMLSKGGGPLYAATYCGDEPYLLARQLPKALVFVGKDRQTAAHMAVQAGAKVILLDDGMQYRRLARDFDIVVVHAEDPFGQNYFLPRGFLRENAQALSRASLIIINHVRDRSHYLEVQKQLAMHSSALTLGTRISMVKMWDLNGREIHSLKGKKVAIFCGIAHPDSFQRTVKELGVEVIAQHNLPDHATFHHKELRRFAESSHASGAEILLCTEKDYVKLVDAAALPIPLVWLQMRLTVVEGNENWLNFISHAKARMS